MRRPGGRKEEEEEMNGKKVRNETMKKLIAVLMALCLLGTACAALADTEPPTWDSMPEAVVEDENTTIEESSYEGEWVLYAAFDGTEYADNEKLFSVFDYDFVPFKIGDGKITREVQNQYGEFVTEESTYIFSAGQLQGDDYKGHPFAVDLLEDGNIVLSVFYPGEGDTMTCLSLFLVHPAE